MDIDDFDLIGSILFDIFYSGKLEKLPGYEQFKTNIESRGAKVLYKPDRGIIRVHNDGKIVPMEALEIAHGWAGNNRLSHAYK